MSLEGIKINWKKVFAWSIAPFIPIWIFWTIINPPWWLRSSPAYTLQLIKDQNYPGGANYRSQVLTPFIIPEIPTSTRPLLLFQITKPGEKYRVLWAYDYIARSKLEFALYKRHPNPKSESGSTRQILRKEIQEFVAKDSSTTFSDGECSEPVFWNKNKHEIYTLSSYPVNGEKFITNYCVIDDRTGKVIAKFAQPNAKAKATDLVTFDEVSKRLIVASSGKIGGVYSVDFIQRRLSRLNPRFKGSYYPDQRTHINSKIILISLQCEGYVVYDIQRNTMSKIHKFPDEECLGPVSYPYSVESISPSNNYILFSRYDSLNNTSCYLLSDYENQIDLDSFCDKDTVLGGPDGHVSFDGWEEE